MNRILLIVLIVILKQNVYSQNKFYTSIEVSPLLSYRSYKLTDYNPESQSTPSGKEIFNYFENVYDSIESSKYGYQVAINIGYFFTNRLFLQSGIQYKNIGLELNQSFPTGNYEIGNLVLPINNESSEYKLFSKNIYIGIPLTMNYKVLSVKNFDLNLSIGGTFDFLVFHKTEEARFSQSSSTREDYAKYPLLNINMIGGVLLNYNLTDRIKIYLNPMFSKYLTPNVKYNFELSDDFYANVNQYYYFGEIKVGLSYMF